MHVTRYLFQESQNINPIPHLVAEWLGCQLARWQVDTGPLTHKAIENLITEEIPL